MVEVYVISAFSKDSTGGNRAGVVLDSHDLIPAKMMAIAKDLGYSETAFLMESDVADFKVRYFTPTEEVPLCGHATIAAFSILNSLGKLGKDAYTIETKAGMLNVQIEKDGMIFMEQNRPTYFETLTPDIFVGCLEAGFIDNERDNALFDEKFEEIAQAIADGILETIGVQCEQNPKLYRVQVGAFRRRENADALLNELKAKGYPAFIVMEDGLYRVQSGAFAVLDNAVKMEERLRRDGYNTFITT